MNDLGHALEAAIMNLLSQRGPGKTAAQRLVDPGEIVVTQRGKIVDPSQVKGPIRLKIR